MAHAIRRSSLVVLATVALLTASSALPSATAQPLVTGTTRVTVHRVGNPMWAPVDVHVFSAPVGTGADGFAEFADTMQALLPPPYYRFYPGFGIGPGTTKEPPPYDQDSAKGVRNAGYPEGSVFAPTQFTRGTGVYFVFMVVPGPGSPSGSSPDFDKGPIIPNSLFPINGIGVTYRDNAVYNAGLASIIVPPFTDPLWNGAFPVDGFSHFPIFIADNNEAANQLGTRLPGLYSFQLTMRDKSGNGWDLMASFVVTGNGQNAA